MLSFAPMSTATDTVKFKAKLSRPAEPKGAAWSFLVLPAEASAKLPTRSQVTVDGKLDGHAFQATLEPDGQGSHWLKVEKKLREAAGVSVGDTVALEVAPVAVEPEPKVAARHPQGAGRAPGRQGAVGHPHSGRAARLDPVDDLRQEGETRVKRIATACSQLESGKRRACCFDRSGIYSNAFCAPEAAE